MSRRKRMAGETQQEYVNKEEVMALWPGDGKWYRANVEFVNGPANRVMVLYSDGYRKSLLWHQVHKVDNEVNEMRDSFRCLAKMAREGEQQEFSIHTDSTISTVPRLNPAGIIQVPEILNGDNRIPDDHRIHSTSYPIGDQQKPPTQVPEEFTGDNSIPADHGTDDTIGIQQQPQSQVLEVLSNNLILDHGTSDNTKSQSQTYAQDHSDSMTPSPDNNFDSSGDRSPASPLDDTDEDSHYSSPDGEEYVMETDSSEVAISPIIHKRRPFKFKIPGILNGDNRIPDDHRIHSTSYPIGDQQKPPTQVPAVFTGDNSIPVDHGTDDTIGIQQQPQSQVPAVFTGDHSIPNDHGTDDTIGIQSQVLGSDDAPVPTFKDNTDDADDEREPDSDEDNGPEVSIPVSMRHECRYDKIYSCVYCEKTYTVKLSRHLATVHKEEENVKAVLQLPLKSAKRKAAWAVIEKIGAYKHNVKVMAKKKGSLIVMKRPSAGATISSKDFRACPKCKGFYQKSTIRIHLKSCVPERHYTINEIKVFYQSMALGAPDSKFQPVLASINEDGPGLIVKEDPLILEHGKNLYEAFEYKRQSEVSQRMGILGRLVQQLRMLNDDQELKLQDVIRPGRFDDVIEAVRAMCSLKPGEKSNSVPSTALKVGHELKHCTNILINQALRDDDSIKERQAEKFKRLHETEWGRKISKYSLSALEHNKKHDPIPFTADVMKVREYIVKRMTVFMKRQPRSLLEYREMTNLVLCRVLLFNAKRGGELARTTISDYNKRVRDEGREDLSLTNLEMELCKRMELMKILGKRSRIVPVLLTPDMQAAIAMLLEIRERYIPEDNHFLFAVSSGSKRSTTGWAALKSIVGKVDGLQNPASLTSTKMRKYLATMSKVLDLKENEVQWLADHMGHTTAVHMKYYKLPSDTIEIAKVGKLLLAVEKGVKSFQGKTIDDIELSEFEED